MKLIRRTLRYSFAAGLMVFSSIVSGGTGFVSADPTPAMVKTVDWSGDVQSYPGFPSTIQKVYARFSAVFGTDAAGNLYGQGSNSCGIFGDPDVVGSYVTSPVQISGITGVTDVAVVSSLDFAIARTQDGKVWSWGCTGYLARATNSSPVDFTPGMVDGLSNVSSISATSWNAAVVMGGSVYTWGEDNNGRGNLGTLTQEQLSGGQHQQTAPTLVPGLDSVVSIASGDQYTIALKADHTVWEWGNVYTGENVLGIFPNVYAPMIMNELTGKNVTQISAAPGSAHAITQAGEMYAWGTDCVGSLGLGLIAFGCENRNQNAVRPTLSSLVSGATDISSGTWLTVVQTSDGLVIMGAQGVCDNCNLSDPAAYNAAVTTGLDVVNFSAGSNGEVYFVSGSSDTSGPILGAFNWSANPKTVTQNSNLSISVTDVSGVVGGEYFIGDTDPGQGNCATMNWDGTYLTTLFGTDLQPGVYKITVRAQDNVGNWSDSLSDYLVVYDPAGPNVTGNKETVPSLSNGDVLPGLTTTGQADKANFGFTVKYNNNGVINASKSDLQFSYAVGKCKGNHQNQCIAELSVNATNISWLVTDGQNLSHGIFQGVATVTLNGVVTTNPFRVELIDGNKTTPTQPDRFLLRIYNPGANVNTDIPLYQINDTVTKGKIKIG